jgi:haloalkane dehalogenase
MPSMSTDHSVPRRAAPKPELPSPLEAFRRGPREFLDVDHSRLAYYRFGSGPDLVFVHGWPLNASTFRNLIPHLADRYTCHLFDLPGAGRTECGPEAPLHLNAHVDTVSRAIRVLGLSRFGLVAHDSGGYIARLVAEDDPRVAGLVLGNTEIPKHTPFLILAYSRLVSVPGFAELMRSVLRVEALRRSPLGFGSCFETAASIDGEFTELMLAPLLAAPRGLRGQLQLIAGLDFTAMSAAMLSAHQRIRARTQLVWGDADTFFPVEKAREMLPQFLAGAEMAEIPAGRLFCHEERAPEFAAHARRFFETCEF